MSTTSLIIRPRSGKFLKDFDLIGKMDPFVRITIGSDTQKTETALDQGKTPIWKTALTFKLSPQQVANLENIIINFECFDEDTGNSADFIGKNSLKLGQLKTRAGEVNTIQVIDNKNKPQGTIDVEIEVRTGTASSTPLTQQTQSQSQVKQPTANVVQPQIQQTQPQIQTQNQAQTSGATLIVKPKSGKFLKDLDIIGKMDPFVRVTVGADVQKTETALNQGTTPIWKTPLTFKLSPQQAANPENIIINFECFDEETGTSTEFIGKSAVKVGSLKTRAGEINTIAISDNKNKPQGTIDVEVELRQPVAQQSYGGSSPQKVQKHTVGTVVVRPTSGRFDNLSDSQELYLVFTHGDVAYQTGVSEGSGKRPNFRDIISFPLYEGEDMTVRAFDNDADRNEVLGEGPIQLSTLSKRGGLQNTVVPLTSQNRRVGELSVEVEFFNDVFENPVKVYPTVSVRKGDYICKKIKYSNPDKFKKNLRVKTENKDLVFVKTERVTILPNEFGEIRFKILAPARLAEDKCRIDIVVEDTNIIEESLLFKVKGV